MPGHCAGHPDPDGASELCAGYAPEAHPITGAILARGPADLVRRFDLPHASAYANACHLCDHARRQLRPRFADILTPDEQYGARSHRLARRQAAQPGGRPVAGIAGNSG